MKKNYVGIVVKILIIVLVLAIDLFSKLYFQNYFESGGEDMVLIKNILGVTYVINTGAAFGIFGDSTIMLSIFTILFIGVFIFIDIYYKSKNGWYVVGFSLIIGGALGNFFDRVVLKGVRDFIEFKFINFPIFNMADTFLTIGVICYVVYLLFYEIISNKKNDIPNKKDSVSNEKDA